MRLGYRYDAEAPAEADAAEGHLRSREAFLEWCERPWVRDLRETLIPFLDQRRSIISVGSGMGEHEVPLALAGYEITASEVEPELLEQTAQLFPELATRTFDVTDPPSDRRYDDMLATGIDYLFDGPQLERILVDARTYLEPDGRVIFVLRYPDTLGTRIIDGLVLPAWASARGRSGREPLRKEAHGYRRSRRELRASAGAAGYTVGREAHALFGSEIQRVPPHIRFPRAFGLAVKADRRLHQFNSVTVFELLPARA